MTREPLVCAIALGSNLGDRRGCLDAAVREIAELPGVRVRAVSRFVETEPVGGPPGQPRFLNGALLLETRVSASELLRMLQSIERDHGRVRASGVRDEPRTLDLDLLTFGDHEFDEPDLTVPHPRLAQRWFVLAPLCEIAPDLAIAGSGRTVKEHLAALEQIPGSSLGRASTRRGSADIGAHP